MSASVACAAAPLRAFQGVGLEIEYMIVQRDSLDVAPVAGHVVKEGAPGHGALGWSNELVAHVVELKNRAPTAEPGRLLPRLQSEVRAMNERLEPLRARLMPTGMHPWMDPRRETRLWPGSVYDMYDRLFDCRSHGWANLQSIHINLPFGDEREFARLHAAIRCALPILPAVAAASPFREGRYSGFMDYRLEAYRTNSSRMPEMTGAMIPEPVTGFEDYERHILMPLYRALEPHDPEGLMRYDWANARGCIARFERSALEIRVVDSQECPAADVALATLIVELVRWLYQRDIPELATEQLAQVLMACIREADRAQIEARYVEALLGQPRACEAGELWAELGSRLDGSLWRSYLDLVLEHGPLARRLLSAAGPRPSRERLARVYGSLCECLERGALFDPSRSS